MKLLRSLPVRSFPLIAFILFSSLTTSAQTANVPTRVTQPVDLGNLVTLQGNTHPLARPEFDQGAAPDSLPMERVLLVLQRSPEQETALRKLLDEQQIKSSPNYHMWLIPEQFGEQFGPADADIQAVTSWLTSQGFQVNRVAAGRTVIEFSGTAGAVRQAFHTEIHRYVVKGEEHWANASDPQIPAELKPVVAGFASLNNFPRQPMIERLGAFSRSKATGEVRPLFTVPTSNGNYYALGPTDFATIYNVLPLWQLSSAIDGTGQTIAIVAESNINVQDVQDFRNVFGLPANNPQIIVDGVDPGVAANGLETEADLDVEWAGAVAKNATIDLVVSESTESTAGVDLSAVYIVDNNLAPVLSESFGACEAFLGGGGNAFHNSIWEQGAAQGITILVASGDSGSAVCDRDETAAQYGLAVSGTASTPFNIAVGGTDFNDVNTWSTYWSATNNSTTLSSALSYIPEMTWNDSCARFGVASNCASAASDTPTGIDLVAGSGGASNCINPTGTYPNLTCTGGYAKPAWQSGTGVPQDGARDLPDVSLFASDGLNRSFYVLCEADALPPGYVSCNRAYSTWYFLGVGGTSASTPAFAGIMALVNQKMAQATSNPSERQGNANYVLYPLAAKTGSSCTSNATAVSNSSCVFYDVVTGNNSVACVGGSPNCSNTTSGGYGILEVNPPTNPSPAWTTNTGYDLATGLGSVNAANLVNKWTSVSFAPSTTTLASLSPTTLTHGQAVNFTVNVAPGSGSGTPTGDISLIGQAGTPPSNVTGIGPFTLSGGSVSSSTSMLPGGSYNVTAHYAGNGSFAASDSPPPGIPVSVGKESSLTELRLVTFSSTAPPAYNLTTAAYGSAYILRMDITNSGGQPCTSATTRLISYPCPTGASTVSPAPTDQNPPAGTVPGSYVLNSQGFAEDLYIQQPPGTYNFVASYAGDNSYQPSTSAALPITITKAPTTVAISGLPSSVLGSHVVFYANISTQSNGAAPTGSVQLLDNGVALGSPVSINAGNPGTPGAYANAQAGFGVDLPLGSSSITVQYSGDGNYAGSTSAAVAVTNADFSLSANPTAISVSAPGDSGSSTLTITSAGLPETTIGLSCVTQYVGTNCTISPAGFNTSGSGVLTATITITTTGQAGAVSSSRSATVPPSFRSPVGWPWLLAGLLALATLMSLATARRRTTLLLGVSLLVAGAWAACGGGGGGGGGLSQAPEPAVNLSPSALTFSSPFVGTTSSAQVVTLQNTGSAVLSISSVTLAGPNAGDFAQTNNCGASVASGANCAINVTFTPTAAGSRSASLTIADNASGSPQSVSLSGSVTAMPVASLSPASLSFGPENDGAATAPQTLTLANTGSAVLGISSIAIQGPYFFDFVQSNTCGASVAAGANCAINVQFKPTSYGYTSTASLAVNDNAAGSPQTSSLTGTALPPVTPVGNFWVNVMAEGEATGAQGFQEWFHQIQLTVTVQ